MGSRKADAARQERLIDAYAEIAPRVYRLSARHDLEAEDIAQDAFERVLRVERPDRIDAPVPFLYRIARNLFIDRLRRRAYERTLFDQTAELELRASESPDAERRLIGKQQLAIALDAIDRLPPRCREAFTLHCASHECQHQHGGKAHCGGNVSPQPSGLGP